MTDQTINSKEANVSSVSDHGIGTSENIIDPELEKRYVRKLDWNILPMVMFMQLVSFLDRSNIGNAKINGMTKDIHLTGSGFNGLFFDVRLGCGNADTQSSGSLDFLCHLYRVRSTIQYNAAAFWRLPCP
jgi:hypothetical protein